MRRLLSIALVGCGSVHPTSSPPPDGPATTTILVDTAGDDASDGIQAPVKTLKRAIGLALADSQITAIDLAAGRYDAANGESFPYTIPANVIVSGPAGGGAIIAGTTSEPGLMLATGSVNNLELDGFMTAVTVTGVASMMNTRFRSAGVAIDTETGASLRLDNLDITGATGGCAIGVQLHGTATVTAVALGTRVLGNAFVAGDASTLVLTSGMIMGDPTCAVASVHLATTGTVSLTGTIIDGGHDGLDFDFHTTGTAVTLADSTIRNVSDDAIIGTDGVTLKMSGGALSNNGRAGLETAGGTWAFTNVTFQHDAVMAMYLQDGTLEMRDSSVIDNGIGLYLFDTLTHADLGTAASPGGNTFQNNTSPSVDLDGNPDPNAITAAGNTWQPNVQGADAQGHYAHTTIPGTVPVADGNNYAIAAGWSLQL